MVKKIDLKITPEDIAKTLKHDHAIASRYYTAFSERCRKDYKLYRAKSLGNETKNQSQIVSSDVFNSVEWILPDLLEIFNGDIFTAKCEVLPDIGVKIRQKINKIFNEKPNGFLVKLNYFKDALIYKHAVAKTFVIKNKIEKTEEFPELTYEEFETIRKDPSVEKIFGGYEITQLPQVPTSISEPEYVVKNVKVKRKYETEPEIKTEILSPDEYRFSAQLDENGVPIFQAHARIVTLDFLKKNKDKYLFGNKVNEIVPYVSTEMKEVMQYSLLEDDLSFVHENLQDNLLRPVELWECHTKIDINNDGLTENVIVLFVPHGDIVLDIQENEDGNMFHRIQNCIDPHKFLGISISEQLEDLQKLNSALRRNLIDNLNRINYGFWRIDPNNLTALSDILTHAGFIRGTKDSIERMAPTPIGTDVFRAMEFFRSEEENKLGVTRYSQGMNAESLNRTAEGIRRIMRASSKRIRTIARIFSETGLSDIANFYAQLVKKYIFMLPDSVKVTASCSVGAAEADQEDTIRQMDYLKNLLLQMNQVGIPAGSPTEFYNVVKETVLAMNRNPEDFISKQLQEMATNPGTPGIGAPPMGQPPIPGQTQGQPPGQPTPQGPGTNPGTQPQPNQIMEMLSKLNVPQGGK